MLVSPIRQCDAGSPSQPPAHHFNPPLLSHHRAPIWTPCAQSSFLLAVYFTHTSVYIYIYQYYFLNSFHPLLPLLCLQISFLSLCLYSHPANKVHQYHLFPRIPYTCVNIWYLFFSFWPISLCMTGSGLTRITTNGSGFIPFSWLRNLPLYTHTTSTLSIHVLMKRLGFSHVHFQYFSSKQKHGPFKGEL